MALEQIPSHPKPPTDDQMAVSGILRTLPPAVADAMWEIINRLGKKDGVTADLLEFMSWGSRSPKRRTPSGYVEGEDGSVNRYTDADYNHFEEFLPNDPFAVHNHPSLGGSYPMPGGTFSRQDFRADAAAKDPNTWENFIFSTHAGRGNKEQMALRPNDLKDPNLDWFREISNQSEPVKINPKNFDVEMYRTRSDVDPMDLGKLLDEIYDKSRRDAVTHEGMLRENRRGLWDLGEKDLIDYFVSPKIIKDLVNPQSPYQRALRNLD